MKFRDLILYVFAFCIFLLMLKSLNFYYLWDTDSRLLQFSALAAGITYYLRYYSIIKGGHTALILFFFYAIAALWNTFQFNTGIGIILQASPFLFFLLAMPSNHKIILLKVWTRLYAVILLVSLIAFWISWIPGVPNGGTVINEAADGYVYTNYWLCIRGAFYDIRFNSLFLEPGHTAMIAAFTLMANNFNLKDKYVFTILICSMFTFSLAGYVLFIIGYFMKRVFQVSFKKACKNIAGYVLLLSVCYIVAISYNNGDNLVNTLIVERLQYDDEVGISGNNRTGEQTDDTFFFFMKSSESFVGMPPQKYFSYRDAGLIGGAGYKLYIMQKGIIGTLFILIFYFLLYRKGQNHNLMLCMLIIYILAFIQRAYPTWESWFCLFVLAMANEGIEKQMVSKNIIAK